VQVRAGSCTATTVPRDFPPRDTVTVAFPRAPISVRHGEPSPPVHVPCGATMAGLSEATANAPKNPWILAASVMMPTLVNATKPESSNDPTAPTNGGVMFIVSGYRWSTLFWS
jgi:hypothetical protein